MHYICLYQGGCHELRAYEILHCLSLILDEMGERCESFRTMPLWGDAYALDAYWPLWTRCVELFRRKPMAVCHFQLVTGDGWLYGRRQ